MFTDEVSEAPDKRIQEKILQGDCRRVAADFHAIGNPPRISRRLTEVTVA
jgi:hypothetical protein